MIERLSGWRLVAFFISAIANFGVFFVLVQWPWMFNEGQLFLVTALVVGVHAVFVIAIAGFRFLMSYKIGLGLGHAVTCVWALASVNAAPLIQFHGVAISTLVLLLLVTLLVTSGGLVIARFGGFHQGRVFSVADGMIVVSAIAILLPVTLGIIPEAQFQKRVSIPSAQSALLYALSASGWFLVVANWYLRFLPQAEHGKTHWQIALGWFLFIAMVSWSHCQFGLVAGAWLWFSMLPIYGLVQIRADGKKAKLETRDLSQELS